MQGVMPPARAPDPPGPCSRAPGLPAPPPLARNPRPRPAGPSVDPNWLHMTPSWKTGSPRQRQRRHAVLPRGPSCPASLGRGLPCVARAGRGEAGGVGSASMAASSSTPKKTGSKSVHTSTCAPVTAAKASDSSFTALVAGESRPDEWSGAGISTAQSYPPDPAALGSGM